MFNILQPLLPERLHSCNNRPPLRNCLLLVQSKPDIPNTESHSVYPRIYSELKTAIDRTGRMDIPTNQFKLESVRKLLEFNYLLH